VRRIVEREILIDFAGLAAGHYAEGRHNWRGASSDIGDAVKLACHVCPDPEEAEAYIRWLLIRAKKMIAAPHVWPLVEALAQALVKHKRLNARRARQIVKAAQEALLQEHLQRVRSGSP